MKTKSTRYNVVGSGILHLLMHSAIAGVSLWGRGQGTLGGVCVGEGAGDPWRCRVNAKSGTFSSRFIVSNLPYLKTVTLTAFRVIFFALFEKFEV